MDVGMDSLLAELLGMGFDLEQIENCKKALNMSSSTSFNLQTALEWLLDNASNTSGGSSASHGSQATAKLVLSPPGNPEEETKISKPMSSSRDLDSSTGEAAPVVSRYDHGPSQRADKKRYENKMREESVKKAKEQRLEAMRHQQRIRQQIQEDRRVIEERRGPLQDTPTTSSSMPTQSTTPTTVQSTPTTDVITPTSSATTTSAQAAPIIDLCSPTSSATPTNLPTPTTTTSATPTSVSMASPTRSTCTASVCRLQVKLPGGGVVRREFSSSDCLNAVIQMVADKMAVLPVTITLAQSYPRREFTPDESQATLLSLNLTPSASLVAIINKTMAIPSNIPKPHPLLPPEPMDTKESQLSPEEELESSEEEEVHEEEEEDDDEQEMEPYVRGRDVRHAVYGGRGHFRAGRGYGRGGDSFMGEGHRLGGREVSHAFRTNKNAAESAALRRSAQVSPKLPPGPSLSHTHQLPSLSVMCMRVLVSHSSHYGMPSCTSISPMLAQRLLAALKTAKKLNSKTLAAFYGCPLHVVNLDNYSLATNELVASISHFPLLTELSLSSCLMITDQVMINTLPYLPALKSVNLSGCSQLSDDIFRTLRGCKHIEELKLSRMKLSDQGLSLLFYYPLCSLRSLDLSHSAITNKALEYLPLGAPILDSLNLEGTSVNSYAPLPRLPCLQSLCLALCPVPQDASALSSLGACTSLQTLSLASMHIPSKWLQALKGLKLQSLKLPSRAVVNDSAMHVVSQFPLTSLDLSDCLKVTDCGISCLASMSTLSSLSLARTKLTDNGMPYLRDLVSLSYLSLANTVVTDIGLQYISSLRNLQELSLSDTRVTSGMILNGCLNDLQNLNRLNLSRTFVSNKGVMALSLPSLVALNLDWTCITDAVTKELLLSNGCPVLETLRNRNINQPRLDQQPEEMEEGEEEISDEGEEFSEYEEEEDRME